MAPTLINVTVFLVFWDPFSSFPHFGGNFLNLSAKITFCAQKSQSRPKLLESCSWIFHFWTRENLEGFFASEECKFWSFLHFPPRMKVNLCFKAKKVAFRERNHAKVEKSTFCIPQSQKAFEIFPFLEDKFPGSGAKPMLLLTFC